MSILKSNSGNITFISSVNFKDITMHHVCPCLTFEDYVTNPWLCRDWIRLKEWLMYLYATWLFYNMSYQWNNNN